MKLFVHCLFLGLIALGPLARATGQAPVINEVHYAPDVKQQAVEFIELYYGGSSALDLAGWRLSGAVEFTFPAGTLIGPGEYRVVAQDPSALAGKYGVTNVSGPWTGRLSADGERIRLRNPAGNIMDSVDYRLGFPWPTVGETPGYSIELIHPELDNELGGNWRASVVGNPDPVVKTVLPAGSEWQYFKGTVAPDPGWEGSSYDDRHWSLGRGPLGYDPDVSMGTALDDMRGAYTQFFLRRSFAVTGAGDVTVLRVEALYDDGFKAWLNGNLLLNVAMGEGDLPVDDTAAGNARENNNYGHFDIPLPAGLLKEEGNVMAVQVANISLAGSTDCFFDARLMTVTGPTARGPSPGRRNTVFATNAPPAIRQVAHSPDRPHTGDAVTVTAKVTDPDGVASVDLAYQVVTPGDYIRFDEARFSQEWTTVAMTPDPAGGDVFRARIPEAAVRHRNLVRYRITARDGRGAEVRVPHLDDPQPNFALFCHDGVPPWTGAVQPGAAGAPGVRFTVGTNEMNRLPVYHLIARKQDVEDSTWLDRSHGDEYFWTGTLVYDGEVYDHIRFRPRGGVWRYAMGKNMWKFDFNRGHDFQARDNWGRAFKTSWTKLNLGACIQQGDFEHRGEQGLFESVGFRLFQLAGLPAPHTSFVQFRIVDAAAEAEPGDQFAGDFWGLYLATEQLDGRFLDEHGLPDGNFYKMESGTGEPNNLGPAGPVNSSDLSAFLSRYASAGELTESWWRTNLNLEAYYSYQAIVQAIHHYDIADGKNYFYYRNPEDGRWTVVPWDLDLTWADNMYRSGQTGGDEPFKSRVLSSFAVSPKFPAVAREFKNRVREIRDLLWNEDEAFRLIDEYILRVRGTNQFSLIDADRAQWDYNPVMADSAITLPDKAGQGRYYQFSRDPVAIPRNFEGVREIMRRYVTYRARSTGFSLDTLSAEAGRPDSPTVTYTGPAGFPVNRLRFSSGGNHGNRALKSVLWRVAAISRPDHPSFEPDQPMHYEIEAAWESGELSASLAEATIPVGVLQVGRLYRVRAQFLDDQGRTSNWSPAVEFTAGEPDSSAQQLGHLRLTEIMYNPPPDGFEYLEFHNDSPEEALLLGGARFTDGFEFTFSAGAVLGPGEFGLLVHTTNHSAFRDYYDLPVTTRLFGPYDGSLDNGGERLTLNTAGGGAEVFRVEYDDAAPWAEQADEGGYSLVVREGGPADLSLARHWRRSTLPGGSPGRPEPPPPIVRVIGMGMRADGLEVQFEADPTTAWAVEESDDLMHWIPSGRFLGTGETGPSIPGG